MSFRPYLDHIEEMTGLTPRQFVAPSNKKNYDTFHTKAREIGNGSPTSSILDAAMPMALAHVNTKGDRIDAKHVGADGSHRDETDRLWLDGKATKSA